MSNDDAIVPILSDKGKGNGFKSDKFTITYSGIVCEKTFTIQHIILNVGNNQRRKN